MEFLSNVDKFDDEDIYQRKKSNDKTLEKNEEEETLKNKEESKENLSKYTDLSPIQFIECIEHKYNLFLPSSIQQDKINQLQKNRTSSTLQFKLLEFTKKEKISSKYFNQKIISLSIQSNNILFIGDTEGITRMISIDNETEIKSFINNDIRGKKIGVSSIDIVTQNTFLAIGYENGYISIFDIEQNKLIININNVHKSKILAIQFLFIDPKKQYEIISTDFEGYVYKINIALGYFTNSIEKTLIYKNNSPTYGIDIFKPFSNKNIMLSSFSNYDRVSVYIIKPEIEELFSEEKNNNIIKNEDILPDISIGWGCEPLIGKDGNILGGNNLEDNNKKNQILICVSWDKILKFYSIDVLPGEQGNINIALHGKNSIGYLINNSPIIRIGFISPSIIYFFDKNFKIKIINTAYCIYGDYNNIINDHNNIIINERAFLEKGFVVDPNIKKMNLSNENEMKKKNCYRQFIRMRKKNIFLGCETSFYVGKLLNCEDCFNDLEKEKKWYDILSLGIDIIQGNITSFPDVPINEKDRKAKMNPFLENLILKYIDNFFREIKNDIKNNIDKILNIIFISIEFCVECKNISFLFNNISKVFDQKGLIREFYKCIEPFIFNDKMRVENISNSIPEIYGTYKLKKELNVFSHLIIHLNYKSINTEFIKRCSFGDRLFSSIIYLFTNGKIIKIFFYLLLKFLMNLLKKIN